jgi:hypothetical protein
MRNAKYESASILTYIHTYTTMACIILKFIQSFLSSSSSASLIYTELLASSNKTSIYFNPKQ